MQPCRKDTVNRYLAELDESNPVIRDLAHSAAWSTAMLERVEAARLAHPAGEWSVPALRLALRHAPHHQRDLFEALMLLSQLGAGEAPTPENAPDGWPEDFARSGAQ